MNWKYHLPELHCFLTSSATEKALKVIKQRLETGEQHSELNIPQLIGLMEMSLNTNNFVYTDRFYQHKARSCNGYTSVTNCSQPIYAVPGHQDYSERRWDHQNAGLPETHPHRPVPQIGKYPHGRTQKICRQNLHRAEILVLVQQDKNKETNHIKKVLRTNCYKP